MSYQLDLFEEKTLRDAGFEGNDLFEGRTLRDAGFESVLDHTPQTWKADYDCIIEHWFCALPTGAEFTGERLRMHVQTSGLGSPGHSNAWGAMASRWIRQWMLDGRVVVSGWESAVDKKAHARMYRLYRKQSEYTFCNCPACRWAYHADARGKDFAGRYE